MTPLAQEMAPVYVCVCVCVHVYVCIHVAFRENLVPQNKYIYGTDVSYFF